MAARRAAGVRKESILMMPMLMLEEKQSASNRTPRHINRNLIFNQIRTRQPISRADLARASGLQRSTVSLIVEELLRERWIVEGSAGDAPRGRKPTGLVVNDKRTVLAVDVHPSQTTLAVADLSGRIATQSQVQLPSDPKKVIRAIVSAIKAIIAEHADCSFEGIGLTVPGRFSHQLKKTVFAPNIGWPIAQIKSRVEEATGLPVVIDNVANACVLSEVWFGSTDESHDIVLVNVSEGIGTGIYVNGGLIRGAGEMAGEFGHVQIDRDGIPCGCGSNGCWETLASNRAGLRYYKEITGESLPSFEALLDLLDKNDRAAVEAITKMCRALGHGLHMIVTTLAPSEIVLVGEFTRVWSRAYPIICDELRRFPLPAFPTLRMATEPGTARLRSGVALVMSEKLL